MTRICRIVRESIDPQAVVGALAGPANGAVATFEGRVRDHHQGRAVTRLDYHAYEEMAAEELERIAAEMEAAHELGGLALVHRIGTLAIGDISVLVAAAAAHRNDALQACAAGIESIKRRVPIWKKEHFADGEPEWIFGPDEICAAGAVGTAPGGSGD